MTATIEQEFRVPDLGEGLEEATVTAWLVAVGDEVELNQPLCVLETAKAEVEIPSPYAGNVLDLRGEPGETLKVGSMLACIATGFSHTVASSTGSSEGGPSRAALLDAGSTSSASRRESVLVGYGVDEHGDRSRRPTSSTTASTSKPLAKPPVRKLARTLGVDLASLHPDSGPDHIITREDVTRAATASTAAQPPTEAEVFPVRGIRARIAERMAASRHRIPDADCSVTVDCDRLLEVRTMLRQSAGEVGHAITPFSLILRLLVNALGEHPRVNATYDEDGPEIRQFSAIHLGVGTATERGLLVPVVRNAEQLGTLALAEEVIRLAAAAGDGTVQPAELTGSTFTVSNFGALGLDEGTPVINYPEAAIVGLGSIKPRPAVRDGELVVRSTAAITCAFDHRVVDGAEAGAFMGRLQSLIETPELALLRS